MTNTPKSGLHQTLTATNDVLQGYDTMLPRADAEIAGVIAELTTMHRRHANALEQRLAALGESGEDDGSLQGTMNAAVVTLRDWITGLDESSLDAVLRGEKAVMDIYDDAMTDWSSSDDPETAALLGTQFKEISEQVARLANR
ncbi:DUF2383 domain-containing protein [Silicimonas algicola]|uniref:Uncharacterized protein (TIGR02284 family) n=1 Tax=Silicimonas algicola TaxID=1826607 RepID=A0A316FYY7_9RHOB|nr:DUF2383 domain-containing protein [Silicimonas algicola]PWK52760.1 uncharacterized protein (TIGR02284 family) [Silicimonas algicola]